MESGLPRAQQDRAYIAHFGLFAVHKTETLAAVRPAQEENGKRLRFKKKSPLGLRVFLDLCKNIALSEVFKVQDIITQLVRIFGLPKMC